MCIRDRKAVEYLRLAGQQAAQRSAHTEAIKYFTSALEFLKAVPDTPQRDQQELIIQTMIGPVLIATKGNAAPEVGVAYKRAVELGRQIGDNAQLFPVLFGMRSFHLVRAELRQARELGDQLLGLSETIQDAGLVLEANLAQGNTLFLLASCSQMVGRRPVSRRLKDLSIGGFSISIRGRPLVVQIAARLT